MAISHLRDLCREAAGLALFLMPGLMAAGEASRMTREIWTAVPGSSLADFKASPLYWQAADGVSTFPGSVAPANVGDNYASRVRGYVKATVTGDYTFWIASGYQSELSISPGISKFDRAMVGSVPARVAPRVWDTFPSQKSAPIRLVAGQRYFVEALQKEGTGVDHLSIAWQPPGGARAVIPAAALESFTADANDADNDELPDTWETANGYSTTDNGTAFPDQHPLADPDHDGYSNLEEGRYGTNPNVRGGVPGSLLLETWNDLSGAKVSDLMWDARFCGTPDQLEFIFAAETPANRSDNFGIRMRGTVTAPVTGNYTFYISGDDACQLMLSTSTSQFEKRKIAHVAGHTVLRNWTQFPSQKSALIGLVAGQKYYIEAVGKEQIGADHLSIGWKKPTTTSIEVIPGSALESYAYDADDADGDNMPAAWETANGLDCAVNDAAADPDYDGIPNLLEYDTVTDPQVKNTFTGALLEELWWNVQGDRTAYLDREPRLLDPPDEHSLALLAKGTENRPVHYANRLRGYITAPISGTYTFWAAGDDEVDFFLSTTASKFDKQLLIHPAIIGKNLDADISMKSREVSLIAGQRYFMEIRHIDSHGGDYCHVAWQKPGGVREIIPGSVLSSFIPTSDDLDDDDVPDAYEIANGLSPNDNGRSNSKNGARGDLDGDGLNNAAEFKAGTRADLADTDGDGVNDRDEVEMMETQALMADAAPFESVTTILGAAYTAVSGSWLQENGRARQDCVRGWLEYPVTLPVAGVYQLNLAFTPIADAGISPDYEIVFSVDEKTIQREIVQVSKGATGHAKIVTPWLNEGSHTIRVFIDNSYHFRRVTVDELEVLASRGPDANGNGTPDWVDQRVLRYNSIEAPAISLTSPVCLEGKSRWSELTKIAGTTVMPAPNDRWYVNFPLNPGLPTAITASLENGSLISTHQISWIPTNLLHTTSLNVRLGDSLKLAAFIGQTGSPEETVTIMVEGRTFTTTGDQALVHTFNYPDQILIQTTHAIGGDLTTAITIINVIAPPVIEKAICVVGAKREFEVPALQNGVTLELDLGLIVFETVQKSDGGKCYTLQLPTLGDLCAVTRIGPNGPVISSIPFYMMRLRTTGQTGVFSVGQVDATTQNIQMPVLVDGLYSGTKIDFEIFIGGVTFDDGTISKSLRIPDDVSSDGQALLHFYKTGDSGSVCHRINVFQTSQKIASF